jgi:hypothetical protein
MNMKGFESDHQAIPLEGFPHVCILVVQPKQSTLQILKHGLLRLKESRLKHLVKCKDRNSKV